jgi:C4-dicarboxylate transporter, DctM subunit
MTAPFVLFGMFAFLLAIGAPIVVALGASAMTLYR